MKVKIMNYFYFNSKAGPILCLCCRDKNRKFHFVQIKDMEYLSPVFGVLREEYEDKGDIDFITKVEDAPDSLYGEQVVKLYTQFPWQVKKLRDKRVCPSCGIELHRKGKKWHCEQCYEDFWKKDTNGYFTQTFFADVKWEKMAMSKIISVLDLDGPYIEIPEDYGYHYLHLEDMKKVDEDDFFLVQRRICYWDIETDARDLPPKSEYKHYKKCPIISITTYDNYEEEYWQWIWHPDFKEERLEVLEDYAIDEIVYKKVIRHEVCTEEEVLQEWIAYMADKRFDVIWGYFSEGGYKKQGGIRKWVNGFDMLCVYARGVELGLKEDLQDLSPCPQITKVYSNRYEGVYLRTGRYKKKQVVIKGLGQLDFVFTDEVMDFARKHKDFRGGRLQDWMEFFLEYEKLDKQEYRVWEYWEQKDIEQEEINMDILL